MLWLENILLFISGFGGVKIRKWTSDLNFPLIANCAILSIRIWLSHHDQRLGNSSVSGHRQRKGCAGALLFMVCAKGTLLSLFRISFPLPHHPRFCWMLLFICLKESQYKPHDDLKDTFETENCFVVPIFSQVFLNWYRYPQCKGADI